MAKSAGISVGGILIVLVAAGAVAFLIARNVMNPPLPDPELANNPQAALEGDWQLQGLDGREVSLSELKGKPIFINLWATWCPPCVAEMPSIEALYRSMKDKGVEFLIVSVEEDDRAVAAKVKAENWSMPVYLGTNERPEVLQTNGIPATFVVDKKGEVVARHIGAADWNTDEVRNFLLKLTK